MAEPDFSKTYGANPAANYERFFVPAIGEPLATDLIRLAALRPGERVLDVACGTGIVARLALQEVGSTGIVAGLDVNPGMLAVARSTAPPAIDWHEASAEAMPLAATAFDVVLCQMGLQFIPDKHGALREMRRVLVHEGRLVLSVPGPMPALFMIVEEAVARHVGADAGQFLNQVFSLHDAAKIRDLLSAAGFRDVSVRSHAKRLHLPPPEEFLWQYVHSTPLAGAVAHLDDARRASLGRDVISKWQQFVEDGALALDLPVSVATARR